ncbi:nhp2-like protein [Anaeramoeba flamelloides]|uniref:H/ACA ribonucleoprotein complex subunit 2 n=1 Tax=Anaeramoeba flamelloides TaxID=1746091 RepID=A0ABQ8XHV5_9EUKA|nr:nhp2-like protein [Anaeramoeba flamelloides]
MSHQNQTTNEKQLLQAEKIEIEHKKNESQKQEEEEEEEEEKETQPTVSNRSKIIEIKKINNRVLKPIYEPRAFPKVKKQLMIQILNLCKQANNHKQVKKGANETMKALNKGLSEFVILAADANPLEIVLHLPLLCEDKNVLWCFVPNSIALGRACGFSRPIIASTIIKLEGSELKRQIDSIKKEIQALMF